MIFKRSATLFFSTNKCWFYLALNSAPPSQSSLQDEGSSHITMDPTWNNLNWDNYIRHLISCCFLDCFAELFIHFERDNVTYSPPALLFWSQSMGYFILRKKFKIKSWTQSYLKPPQIWWPTNVSIHLWLQRRWIIHC